MEWKDAHNFMGSEDYLPLEVVEWAELPDENPWIFIKTDTRGEKETTLVDVNDEGYTFTEIADIIEARL